MRSAATPLTSGVLSRPAAIFFSALLVILLFRIVALYFNATDLFFDEAQYWSWGKEPSFGYYSKPPLIAWIIGLTTGICGDSTFCIRLPAPLLHTATAAVIYVFGRRHLTEAAGIWAGLTFATLPGVSLSAGIISTDVPLLLCWALALLAYAELARTQQWWPALLLGLAIGLGLNAKYAMVFFVVSAGIHLAATPDWRRRLAGDPRLWLAFGLGALLLLPNLAWNLSNSFATFAHTADNARWGSSLVNIGKGLEFLAAQLGVFGPILFVALLTLVHAAWRQGLPDNERLLLCFTLPVLLLITVQAFLSRAHANWAATAYVAGSLLVATALIRLARTAWLKRSLALHLVVGCLLAVGAALAGRFALPALGDPYHRTLGWKQLAEETRAHLEAARVAGKPFAAVFADERAITAELLYYLRREPTPIRAWHETGRPRDHYELTRPLSDKAHTPALLVSVRRDASKITQRFGMVEDLGEKQIPAGLGPPRKVRFLALSDLKPK